MAKKKPVSKKKSTPKTKAEPKTESKTESKAESKEEPKAEPKAKKENLKPLHLAPRDGTTVNAMIDGAMAKIYFNGHRWAYSENKALIDARIVEGWAK